MHAPLTGFAAADGKSARIAAEIAADDLNKAGGILGNKVVLKVYDDQAQGSQAVILAKKMIGEDHTQFAISGSYSEPTRAAATVFQEAHIPYIAAYAVHPDITKAGDYVFRTFHLAPPQGRVAAKFLAETLKLKRISIVSINNDFGVSLLEGFKGVAAKAGIEILREYTYSPKDRQFGSVVASVKRDNPEALYVTGYAFTGGPLVAQLRAAGVTVPIVAAQAFDSQTFIDIAGAAADGIYVVNALNRDNPSPVFKNFMAELKQRQGNEAESTAAAVYTAVMLAADAIKRAGSTDPAKVRDALAATKDFPAMHGKLVGFDDHHEIMMSMPVIVIKNGKFTHFSDVTDEDGK
ncbi:ABC transporter substrate-binding protein [Bradyrhizobium genosp. P]|uniref:ABC transporter substrate-binding protein n=1 Tax=Bradyrhizobium genosp. P TaxID=83641 RepID=UPI003CECFE60